MPENVKTLLEERDKRILAKLDSNSRMSYEQLAYGTGMSAETARYRVNALVRKGVIQKFYTIIDWGRLGLTVYKIYIRLQSANEARIREIINYLHSQESVMWILRFDGGYDLAFALNIRQVIELSEFVDKLLKKYSEFISRKSFGINIHTRYFPRRYLGEAKTLRKEMTEYRASGVFYDLTLTDREILKILSLDCRFSASEIAHRLATRPRLPITISRETVLRHIKQLEKDRIITGYTVFLNHNVIGQLHYRVLLYMNRVSEKELKSFVRSLESQPRLWYLIKILSEWDYELGLEVESVSQYRDIMSELTSKHPAVLRDYIPLVQTEAAKYQVLSFS